MFEHTLNAMVMVSDDRVYVDCNRAAALLFECSREQLIGRRIDDFTPVEWRDQLPLAWARFREAGTADGVYELLTATSQRVAVQYSATAHFLPGLHLSILIAADAAGRLDGAATGRARKRLSPREREVLERVALGVDARQISHELFISPETVRTHLRNTLTKLDARTRAHATAIALQTGEINAAVFSGKAF